MLATLEPNGSPAAQSAPIQSALETEVLLSKSDFKVWLKRLREADLFAFDTETTSLDYMAARIVGVSFAVESGSAAYVPLAHDYPGAPQQLERAIPGGHHHIPAAATGRTGRISLD